MVSKRERLAARAAQTARQPQPGRLLPRREPRGYRVVTVSLYVDQANWVDQEAAQRRVRRSTVIQSLIDAARLH